MPNNEDIKCTVLVFLLGHSWKMSWFLRLQSFLGNMIGCLVWLCFITFNISPASSENIYPWSPVSKLKLRDSACFAKWLLLPHSHPGISLVKIKLHLGRCQDRKGTENKRRRPTEIVQLTRSLELKVASAGQPLKGRAIIETEKY